MATGYYTYFSCHIILLKEGLFRALILQPVLFRDHTVISMNLDLVSDMQTIFFCKDITIVHILYIRVDEF